MAAVKSFKLSLTVSTDQVGYNVRAAAITAGWNGTTPLDLIVTNNAVMYAANTGLYGCYIDGTYPAGSKIGFINNSYVVGRGGNGGSGGGGAGSAGGPALYIAAGTGAVISITNNGTIGGGGLGGSGGPSDQYFSCAGYLGGGGGGGGAGFGSGGGGVGPDGTCSPNGGGPSTNGNAGTVNAGGTPGAGAYAVTAISTVVQSSSGATGGSLGNGAATQGAANATWIVTGTRLGAIN